MVINYSYNMLNHYNMINSYNYINTYWCLGLAGNEGMIHFITINNPSNPQQPIHSLLSTSKFLMHRNGDLNGDLWEFNGFLGI